MKKKSYKLSELKAMVRSVIREALANKFGQGGDIKTAENVANAHWGSVYNVMPKGEAKNEVFYRVQLHNSGGPVKYLKQDSLGRWYFMEPPALNWRPINPAKVPQATSEVTECATCGCGNPDDTHDEPADNMQGDVTDVRTMDTANLGEGVNPGLKDFLQNIIDNLDEDDLEKIDHQQAIYKLKIIKRMLESLIKDSPMGEDLNEETSSGAVFSGGPTIQTPYAFSKKGSGSKKAMDATKKIGYKPAKKEY